MRSFRRLDLPSPLIAGLVALFLVLVIYGPGVGAGGVLVPVDMLEAFSPWSVDAQAERPINGLLGDQVQQMYPWRVFVHREIAAGRFPLWNPWNGGGAPLFANGQSAVLFPLNVLTLWLHPALAATVVQLAKPPLAAVGTALFLRALGVGGAGSVFGGVAWAFAGPMVTWLGWPHTNALAVLPYLFWTAVRWFHGPALRWWLAHAVCVCVQLFGGHPETSAHSVFGLGIFLAGWSLPLIRPMQSAVRALLVSGVRWGANLAAWVGAVLAGATLAAVQVVPLLEAIGWSMFAAERSSGAQAAVVLERETLLTWLLPDFFGTPLAEAFGPLRYLNYNETVGYVGLGTLVLAVLSLAARRHLRSMLGLWAVVVLALGLTYGWPLITELRHLPGLGHAANTRFVYLAAFGLACLAGLGLDAMLSGRRRYLASGFATLLLVVGSGLAVVGALSSTLLPPTVEGSAPLTPLEAAVWRQTTLWTAAGLLLLWAGALAMAAALPRRGAAAGVVIAVLLLDLGAFGGRYNPVISRERLDRTPAAVRFILDQDPGGRAVSFGDGLLPNASMLYGLQDFRIYEPVAHRRMLGYFAALDPEIKTDVRSRFYLFLYNPELRLLDLAGVRWVLLPTHDPRLVGQAGRLEAYGYARRFEDDSTTVWEAPAAHPRVYVASQTRTVVSEAAALEFVAEWTPAQRWEVVRLGSTGAHTRSVAEYCHPEAAAEGSVTSATATERILRFGRDDVSRCGSALREGQILGAHFAPGFAQFDAELIEPGFVVYNDTLYPGWTATVDGVPVPLQLANYLFMGVDVPAGRHRVRFEYQPESYRLGLTVSGVTIVSIIVLVLTRRKAAPRNSWVRSAGEQIGSG